MSRLVLSAAAAALLLAVAACDSPGGDASPPADAGGQPAPAPGQPEPAPSPAAPLTPAGTAQTVSPDASDASVQAAANVVRIDPVSGDQAKLFGIGGGDPAMNGLQTYIAFFASPAEGWTVFRIGDVLDYSVLSSSPGRVDLDLTESTYDQASGQIGSAHRRVIVQWTMGAGDTPPASVTVTPAQ